MSRRTLLVFGNLVLLSSLLAWATNDSAVLQGDAVVYLDRVDPILEGALPYIDTPFEHLPLSLMPLLLAAVLDTVPGINFINGLAIVNAAFLGGVLWYAHRLGDHRNEPALPDRWLLVAGPLFPIVLYRTDALSLLFCAIAYLGLVERHAVRSGMAALAGVATRGWPVVLALGQWGAGWRRLGISLVAVTAGLGIALLAAPGFTAGRTFSGVQIETMVGSLLLVSGHVRGVPATIQEAAGSLYVGTGAWPALVNASIGVVLVVTAVRRAGRFPSDAAGLAIAVYGILLVSPLLSAQMLVWPTLFVATLAVAPAGTIAATGLATTALLTLWNPGGALWAVLLLARNLVLAATPLLIAERQAAQPGREASAEYLA